jgi:act minimal PKS ketosynthase (KS/KS alpha)
VAERVRVVVTGIGSVGPLGVGGSDTVSEALARGVPAVGPMAGVETADGPSRLAAVAADVSGHLSSEETRRLARASQFAVVACRLALADAGVEAGALAGLGLVLGSHYGDFRSSEEFALGYLRRGPLGLSPVVFPNTVMNAMAAQAAIAVGAQGPMLTLNQAGAAGEVAVGRGAALIAARRAPAVLAGGVDELSPILYRELSRLGLTSPRDGRAEGCWPFDRRANGSVLGEGATVVLLEDEAAARGRGARPYAVLAGAAWGNLPAPAHGVPAPRRRDPAVVRRALALAEVAPADVDAVYASGHGDRELDACELDLLAAAFRSRAAGAPPLTALTPLAGEHAGLGGLRVAAAAATTIARGRLPGLPDLAAPLRDDFAFATGPAREIAARTVLVHGLARGGGHAALVLTRAA